ncbi:MAG: RagB/SusD family nutrient uptake outer membrane protein [Cyclobacteriaceae bacterium]|nr:RagB/SusD family nutrient uptake outer membrane protein [Cyclobacteriaceae bacterium]
MKKVVSKYKLGILILVSIFVITSGCEDLLNENPRTFLSQEIVFQTAEGANSATIGIYKPLSGNDLYGWWLLGNLELFSDYVIGRGSQAPPSLYQLDAAAVQRIGFVWRGLYQVINRSNIVISQLETNTIQGMSAEYSNSLIGEARFLRALCYFHLVRLFGDVPLRTVSETNPANLSIARARTESVYEQIVEDLKFGEIYLPASYSQSDLGRVTKWAAKGLLADVYLTLEQWGNASLKAKEVIEQGPFKLVEVRKPEDFQKIFGPDVLTHSEEIFSIKHARIPGLGFGALWLMHRAGSGYSLGNNAHAWMGNLNSWLGAWRLELDGPDLRPNDWLYNGPSDERFLGPGVPMLFKKFRDTESAIAGNDFPVIRFPEILFIYAEAESQLNGGPTPTAYEAINSIRRRAFGRDINVPDGEADLPLGLSAQEFRNEVLLERAKEFVMEGKRWYDLLRTDTAIDIIRGLGLPIEEKHLKWPIPAEEIDNNTLINQTNQNPGW